MAHKYYLNEDYLFRDRKEDHLFELVCSSTTYSINTEWHIGNTSYGGEQGIKMWNMREVSIEEIIKWLLDKPVLNHILKEILQQYIDENYKVDLNK